MKPRWKAASVQLLTLALAFVSGLAVAKFYGGSINSASAWLNPPPQSIWHNKAEAIQEADIYEVTASMSSLAFHYLQQVSFLKLTPEDAKRFVGVHYVCPEGKLPYLVRAVYGYSGTGKFTINQMRNALVIKHGSLGHSTTLNKTAFVVNLNHNLETVYTAVSIAQ